MLQSRCRFAGASPRLPKPRGSSGEPFPDLRLCVSPLSGPRGRPSPGRVVGAAVRRGGRQREGVRARPPPSQPPPRAVALLRSSRGRELPSLSRREPLSRRVASGPGLGHGDGRQEGRVSGPGQAAAGGRSGGLVGGGVGGSVGHSLAHSVGRSLGQSLTHSLGRSVTHSLVRSVGQSVTRSVSQRRRLPAGTRCSSWAARSCGSSGLTSSCWPCGPACRSPRTPSSSASPCSEWGDGGGRGHGIAYHPVAGAVAGLGLPRKGPSAAAEAQRDPRRF